MLLIPQTLFEQLDRAIMRVANEDLVDPNDRIPAREQWVLHRLDQAALLVAFYLCFVCFSLFFLYDAKAEKMKADAAEKVKGMKKKKLTLAQKVQQKGALLFFSMVAYNAVQVGLCGYMVREAALAATERNFSLLCNTFETNPKSRRLMDVLHVFYLSKVLDFLDTVFMVVKGNWRQVSFLHVYHHSSIFLIYWLILNGGYDGDIYFTIVANGFIHFVMYSYYLATTLNVQVPIALKKLVTNMQLVQFACMIFQALVILLNDQCEYPTNITWLYLTYIISMFVLFSQFKRKTYKSRKNRLEKNDARMHDPVTS